jgi:serpin B
LSDEFGIVSAPETLDYSDTEAARTKINMWVADHTHNLITELFRQGGITRDAMMTIVSAIYFKGDWATPFKAELTEKASFVVEGGDKVDAPTMRQSGQFPHRFSDNFNVVRLPYAGDEVAMDIFVPVGSETVRGLISKNVFTFGIEHLDDFKNSKIDLSMPSFKIEYLVELNAYLQQLGMVDAFGSSADFSEMATGFA